MTIVGIVLALRTSILELPELLALLRSDSRIELGPSEGQRLALTLEAGADEVRDWLEEVSAHDQVAGVFPVYVAEGDPGPSSGRH